MPSIPDTSLGGARRNQSRCPKVGQVDIGRDVGVEPHRGDRPSSPDRGTCGLGYNVVVAPAASAVVVIGTGVLGDCRRGTRGQKQPRRPPMHRLAAASILLAHWHARRDETPHRSPQFRDHAWHMRRDRAGQPPRRSSIHRRQRSMSSATGSAAARSGWSAGPIAIRTEPRRRRLSIPITRSVPSMAIGTNGTAAGWRAALRLRSARPPFTAGAPRERPLRARPDSGRRRGVLPPPVGGFVTTGWTRTWRSPRPRSGWRWPARRAPGR